MCVAGADSNVLLDVMADPGWVVFLPWVTLPQEVELGGFRFVPVEADRLNILFTDRGTVTSITGMLRGYINTEKKPITSCTIMTKPESCPPWYTPETEMTAAFSAARTLALAAMSEQRFFEGHFAPHTNATAFRPIGQRISPPGTGVAVSIPWRDGGLATGGLKFGDFVFQEPLQVHRTGCPEIPGRFVAALEQARRDETETWDAIEASLPIWLLGNSEDMTLSDEACVTLDAIAFERLLRPKPSAQEFAKAFGCLWSQFGRTTVASARRVKADPKFKDEQQSWLVCQKWARELYEERNVFSHHRRHAHVATNWTPGQHLVLAAYTYPLTVKLLLERDGTYTLSDEERGCCFALDPLLDRWKPRAHDPLNNEEDWDSYDDRYGRPTWSKIVGIERAMCGLMRKGSR
jgi:hypothetical protein